MGPVSLGIRRLHSLEICVHDAKPWLEYLTRGFGFQRLAAGTGAAIEATGTRRHLLRCKDVCLVLLEAVHAGSSAKRFLEAHPEGISTVNMLVDDLAATEAQLIERHATPTDFITREPVGPDEWKSLGIATPVGDVEFRFVEVSDEDNWLMPGMEACGRFDPGHNPMGLTGIDHLIANARTMMPLIAFYEHVLGFERFWDVSYHTEDFSPGVGGGLKSVVMWDRASGIKMAVNEPLRPRFEQSQIQMYVDTNRGPGMQHVALGVADLMRAAAHCEQNGITFLAIPQAYYTALPRRLRSQGVPPLDQPLEELARHRILADGDKSGSLLQVFCRDQAAQFKRPNAGPLFFEMIQRCGCKGFGEGNFRALFEATEAPKEHSDAGRAV